MFSSIVLAGISINEPLDIYNLGDRLYVSANGVVGIESGNFNIDLVCSNNTINLVKIPARAFSSEENVYDLPYKIINEEDLEIGDFSSILGTCQIIATIGETAVSTKSFLITDEVSVRASLDKGTYNPGEGITIKIDAIKANGDLLDGIVEITGATIFSKAIQEGLATNTFSMSETAEAGVYYLNVSAYDSGKNGILNHGSAVISFSINQVPTSIVLSLSDNSIIPGNELKIGAEIFDQSGKTLQGSVSGKLISPEGIEEDIVFNTGEFFSKQFETNATSGIWIVRAFFNEIGQEKEIEVKELQKIDLVIEDSILIIKNIGNTLYNKTVNVQIGNTTKEIDLRMEIGETRKFNLAAPQGEYEVIVGDGEAQISNQVMLTGKAISIKDLEDVGIFKSYSIVWIFLIVVFGGIGAILFRKFKRTTTLDEKTNKKRLFERIFKSRKSSNFSLHSSSGFKPKLYKSKGVVDLTNGKINSAESSLVLKGEKYPSAVVLISIKNFSRIKEHALEFLSNTIDEVKTMKGLVDWKDDHVSVIFSTVFTKTYDNEILASKAAFRIWRSLLDYNNKVRDKIEFNIGVNSGEIVASKSGDKLEYTGIGNIISLARRMSDFDSEKILVSENIRKKLMRDLRVEKVNSIGDNPVYSATEIRNKEANEAKLKDLLKRANFK